MMITALKQKNVWLSPEIHPRSCPGPPIICLRAAESPFWSCCRLSGLASIVQEDWSIMWVLKDTFSLWKKTHKLLEEKKKNTTLYSQKSSIKELHIYPANRLHLPSLCFTLTSHLARVAGVNVLLFFWKTSTFSIIWCYWPINNWKWSRAVP